MSQKYKHSKNCTCVNCGNVPSSTLNHAKQQKGPKGHQKCHEKCHKQHKCCTGPTGPTGPAGSSGEIETFSTVIPYSSGFTPVTLSLGQDYIVTDDGIISPTGAIVGFGESLPNVGLTNENLDFGDIRGLNPNFMFVVPRDGVVDDFYFSFQSSAITNIIYNTQFNKNNSLKYYKAPSILQAALYRAPFGSTIYTKVSNNIKGYVSERTYENINLETHSCIVKTINIGDIIENDITDINFSVEAGDKLILFFNLGSDGTVKNISFTGYLSAGVTIS